jgi:non-specific serine/threonine protein kinase/serine/threonine-protein kinase
VALKVIKAGMDTAQVVSRFEAERQALALMDHPAIATVYDGGSTPEGRPYFAMEYVKGEPITNYCDRQRLTTQARLELFMQVCEGVQHAHQKGIIHRDLKPSNVLVTIQDDHPVPKIIDFGVAKATAQHLTERTLYTELGVMIGTPEYMSPEQAEMGGLDIDTRTDIYALGVILYELLTGVLPFERKELREAGFAEIQRTIREKEPPKPSTRITQLGQASTDAAAKRHTEPRRLVSELRGDLDWVTMKALEKDRTRRYQTANALAADVRHHLSHEPVSAGPPSTVYRARKFVRRHRFGVAATATLALLLVAFGITMAVQAQRIARERDRANQEAARANQEAARANREAAAAKQVSDFLTGLFKATDPAEAKGDALTAREIVDRGVRRIDAELGGQPELQVRLLLTISGVYTELGLYETSLNLDRRCLDLARHVLGDAHRETARAVGALGTTLLHLGRLSEAEPYLREVLVKREHLFGTSARETLWVRNNLAAVLFRQGKFAEAEQVFEQLVELRRQVLGLDDPDTLSALGNLAATQHVLGKWPEADQNYRTALEGTRRSKSEIDPSTLLIVHNLGELMILQRRFDDADRFLREALDGRRKVLPHDHPEVATTLSYYGALRNAQGRFSEAEGMLRESLAIYRAGEGKDSADIALAESRLGEALTGRHRHAEAEGLVLRGCEGVLASAEFMDVEKRLAVQRVIAFYEAWGKPDKAAEWRTRLPKPVPPEPAK